MNAFDVAVVGAGVVGCSVARELAKFKLNVVVLEKEADVAEGASGANSGVIHSGFKEPRLSLKALYCVEGNKKFSQIARELEVPYKVVGTYTVGISEADRKKLGELKEAGEAAGAKDLEIIEEKELKKREPHVQGRLALYAPEGGITDPHKYVIALAENAAMNGVKFCFNTEVTGIEKKDGGYQIKTSCGVFQSKFVVNCAGLHADEIANMVGFRKYKVNPCRGEYFVLDKKASQLINGMIYPMPPEKTGGIGVHLTPSIDSNILIGPSAEYIDCKQDLGTTARGMHELFEEAVKLVPELRQKYIIHEYSGLRSKLIKPGSRNIEDFVIEENPAGFIHLFGIESPGLTAAPVLASKVRELIGRHAKLQKNPHFNPKRKKMIRFSELSKEEKARLIKQNPDYGVIVCRCEEVSKKEIIDALNNPLGVRTLKGIRIRTRAGMGRCQGSFCMPKIMKLVGKLDFTLKGGESRICHCSLR